MDRSGKKVGIARESICPNFALSSGPDHVVAYNQQAAHDAGKGKARPPRSAACSTSAGVVKTRVASAVCVQSVEKEREMGCVVWYGEV